MASTETKPAELATMQREAEGLVPVCSSFAIETAAEYSEADEVLSAIARKKAYAIEVRKSWTAPIYEGLRKIEADFRPLVSALEKCEKLLKGSMGDYRVAREKEEREARELAAQAAEVGDAGALVEALTVATEAGAKPDARSSARFMWAIESVNPEKLPIDYFIPDLARLEGLARSAKGDVPPVVPGVTFKRVAQIGARK